MIFSSRNLIYIILEKTVLAEKNSDPSRCDIIEDLLTNQTKVDKQAAIGMEANLKAYSGSSQCKVYILVNNLPRQ